MGEDEVAPPEIRIYHHGHSRFLVSDGGFGQGMVTKRSVLVRLRLNPRGRHPFKLKLRGFPVRLDMRAISPQRSQAFDSKRARLRRAQR